MNLTAKWIESPGDHSLALVIGDMWLGYVMLADEDSDINCACLGAGMTAPCIGGSRDVEEAKRLVESAVGDGS
jgi:hypothetical protein